MVNPGPVDTGFFDARGHAYDRSFPRTVPPERIAESVIRAVDQQRREQLVPRWLRPALVFRHLVPPAYELGTRRSFKRELEALEHSRSATVERG